MEPDEIRARLTRLRETADIPCDAPQKTWAGNGQGRRCAGCGDAIHLTEVEYEVDLRSGITLRLHRTCYAIWMEVCADGTAGLEGTSRAT